MNRTLLAGTGAAAAISVALALGPAFAQIDPGNFTTANVDPADPFGELTVDTAVTDIPAYLATLDPAVRAEVEERCSVITSNATLYDAVVVAFCTQVIAAGTPMEPALEPAPVTPAM
ncbi:MAG: hypothetical protein KIS68_12105 [Bauldia sp.]|nr:hypothetical protein [Bauldia sp.]